MGVGRGGCRGGVALVLGRALPTSMANVGDRASLCVGLPTHSLPAPPTPPQWNSAASHRIQTYGAQAAVEGDLVLPRAEAEAARAASRNRGAHRQQQQQQQGGDEDGGAAAGGAADDEAVEEAAAGVPHLVTAEEAAAGSYSIEDVVLPMPGLESLYPGHDTAAVYRRLAAADGVSLDAPAHGCTDFSLAGLAGAYRHVLHRPADLEVRRRGSGGCRRWPLQCSHPVAGAQQDSAFP